MHNKLLRAILRNDFSSFIHKTFYTINPSMEYFPNWHIELIAEKLEEVRKGNIKRLIINMPPRALKSVCVSVAWPAWLLGQDPSTRIMIASYSQILSIKHSMDCRFVVTSDWYQTLFPKTILSKTHNQKSKFMTTNHGFRFSTSVGGSATGEGGDVLIIDDPHNPSHIHSQKMRTKVIEWFEQTFLTRLNSRSNGSIILVMQRLHEEDLSGYLMASDPGSWEILKIPAICNISHTININGKIVNLTMGDPLHQGRDTKETILQIEKEMGRENFAAQYLQEPISKNSVMIASTDIKYSDEKIKHFDYYVQSWDTAIKVSESSDYSVCTTWGVISGTYYLVHLLRMKMDYPSLKKTVQRLNIRYNPKIILIEDKASGQSLIQDLQSEGFNNIIAQKPKLDKITRFAAVLPLFQEHRVILPKQASWLQVFIKEITTFPSSKHDDIVDSVSQFLGYMKNNKKKTIRIREI